MRMFRQFTVFAALAVAAIGFASAQSSGLTNGQKNTLRTAIQTEPALAAAYAIRDDQTIAAYCNATASPVQKVWRTTYSADDLFQATALTEYIARSAAERQAYDLLVAIGTMDPTKGKLRSGIVDIFSGSTNSTSRAAILNDMTRNATWCEQKLGGTNATTDVVTAWRSNWTGTLSPFEISTLLNGN